MAASSGTDARPLATRVMSGGLWSLAGVTSNMVIKVGAGIVVARYLAPHDFAVFALGVTVFGLALRPTLLGFDQSIIRETGNPQELASTVFWLMLVLSGVVLAPVMVGLGGWLSDVYSEPRLAGVLPLFAVSLVATVVGRVPIALLNRQMRFRGLNLLQTAVQLITAATTAALAIAGFDHFALVIGHLLAPLISLPLLMWLARFRPSPVLAWGRVRRTMRFGAGMFTALQLIYLADMLPYFVLGRTLNKTAYGYYHFSWDNARQPVILLGNALRAPLLSAFSRIREEPGRMGAALVRVTRLHFTALGLPALGILLLADPAIVAVFGPQWAEAVPLIRAFSIVWIASGIGEFTDAGFVAIGAVWQLAAVNALRLAGVIVMLVLGAADWPLQSLVVGLAVVHATAHPLKLLLLARLMAAPAHQMGAAVAAPAASLLAGTGAWALLVAAGLGPEAVGVWPWILLAGTAIVAGWLAGTLVVNRAVFREARAFLRGRAASPPVGQPTDPPPDGNAGSESENGDDDPHPHGQLRR